MCDTVVVQAIPGIMLHFGGHQLQYGYYHWNLFHIKNEFDCIEDFCLRETA